MDSRDSPAPSHQGDTGQSESDSLVSRLLSPAFTKRRKPLNEDYAATKNLTQVSERGYQRSVHSYESLKATSQDAYDPGKFQSAVGPTLHVQWKGMSIWVLSWELLGIIVSICFLVLGACVAALKDHPESNWSNRVVQAMRVAPSLWPILFSGIMGNAVRGLADWRVEKGIKLMDLEQLLGSLTMAGAWITIFKWSLFKLSSVALVVLWAFNPLGSQASFRGAYLVDELDIKSGQISYYNHNLTTQLGMTQFSGQSSRTRPTLRALYSAVLYDVIASTQYVDRGNSTFEDIVTKLGGHRSAGIQAAMDPWGNIRLPNMDYINGYNSNDSALWIDTPWTDSVQNYASLVGERIEGVQRDFVGNTSFGITSSYQKLNCSPWKLILESDRDPWFLDMFGQNMTTVMSQGSTNKYRSFLVRSSLQTTLNKTETGPPKIIFASYQEVPRKSLITTSCSASTTYVDAKVDCMSKGLLGKANCGVSAIRKMQGPSDPPEKGILDSGSLEFPNTTYKSDPLIGPRFFIGLMDYLDDNQIGSGTSSVVERYIQDPFTALIDPKYMEYTQLGNLDIKIFEQRFALLYNTLWKVGWSYASVTGADLMTATSFDTRLNVTSDVIIPLAPVYAINMPWMVLYFISVGVMFLAAVFSLVTHSQCRAPPILGYASSLVRDSTYFFGHGAQGNSVEDGAEKTKRLGDMRVMIADIKGDEVVGKVAFAPADTGKRVKTKRWYE